MTENERQVAWETYKKTGSQEIREQLILEYAPLVKIVAGRLSMYLGFTVEYEDLTSYGIFGLIDAIREDGEASKHAKNLRRIYSNNIFKEFGLPPFPQQQESETVADEHGNPTKSFIQKSVEAVKAFFRNEQ